MENVSLQTAEQICRDCRGIGERLEQSALVRLAKQAEAELQRASGLRVAFITGNLAGGAAALMEAFGIRALPEGMGVYQAVRSAKIVYTGGTEERSEGAEQLEQEGEPAQLSFTRRGELPESVEAELIFSREDFSEFDWKKELAQVDYAFLVVSALQMLSAPERELVEHVIMKYFGLARFSIVLSDTGMVNSPEAYEELQSRLNWYLNSIGGGKAYELETETLRPFITEELLRDGEELKLLAVAMTAKLCCEDTEEAVRGMKEEASADLAKLEESIAELGKREAQMKNRAELAAGDLRGEILGTIHYRASEAVRKLFAQLQENICATVERSEDVQQTKENIPRFMEMSLGQLGTELEKNINADAVRLEERLEERMHKDAGEFFQDIPWIPDAVSLEAAGAAIRTTVTLEEGATQTKVRKLSKALLIGTVPVLIFGSLPLAVGTLVGSQLVKKMSRNKIEAENREALRQAVQELCTGQEQEFQKALKQKLQETAESGGQRIRDAYREFVGAVMDELIREKERILQAREKEALIDRILSEELPRIKALLPAEQ